MKQTEEPMELPRNARERIDEARPRADQAAQDAERENGAATSR